jgi:hypothetical protein
MPTDPIPSGSPLHSDVGLFWPNESLAAWALPLVEVNVLESQALQQTVDRRSRILLGGS